MPDKALDRVEWELVRADIAMEKARLKANGDWSKWEEFQTRTNAKLERALIGWPAQRGRGLPMTEDERIALWWVVRTPRVTVVDVAASNATAARLGGVSGILCAGP